MPCHNIHNVRMRNFGWFGLTLPMALAARLALGPCSFFERPLPVQAPPAKGTAVSRAPMDACAQKMAVLETLPARSGARQFERQRAEILARAKASPVLFLREPLQVTENVEAARLRQDLTTAPYPWHTFERLLKQTRRRPELLRDTLLCEGYLYTESPALAVLISTAVTLPQLFTEPTLLLIRGETTYPLERRGTSYVYTTGPDSGRPATLLLFDRVLLPTQAHLAPLHVSLETTRDALGAKTFQVTHLTDSAVIGQFQYGDLAIKTLLRFEERRAVFTCESVPTELAKPLEHYRAIAHRQRRVIERLRQAVSEQVEEALPFDEPKTEEGQQDGKLRQEWRTAYRQGSHSFEFNGDRYSVFDARGRPRTPQVCADFITDSWERMSGTYYSPRGQPREKRVGRLDFDALDVQNRRSVEKLMDYAASHPDWFELLLIPESERITFANRNAFFARLAAMHDDFAPGDVVTILGPRDDERLHYHSFFILASDPITGIPTTVVANAGRPRVRSWEGEMQNAPRRSIYGRIRPTLNWLESITGLSAN